jgi:hypothetical protein
MTNQFDSFLIGSNNRAFTLDSDVVRTNLQVTTAMVFAVGLYLLAALVIF